MILTFTEYKSPTESKNGKMMPPKVKGSDGQWYSLARDIVEVPLNVRLECTVSSKPSADGKYTYWDLKKVELPSPVPIPTPVPGNGTAAPLVVPTRPPSAEKNAPTHEAPRFIDDTARQRLIVRQTALKAAVELADEIPDVLRIAGQFVSWIMEEGAYELSPQLNRDEEAEPGVGNSASSSPAQIHLAEAREKARDRRADYADEDAVCPKCGYKDFLGQGSSGWFCSAKRGGCGNPERGVRLDAPMTWGEWKQAHHQASAFRRPDAPVVSPSSHPSRTTQGDRP